MNTNTARLLIVAALASMGTGPTTQPASRPAESLGVQALELRRSQVSSESAIGLIDREDERHYQTLANIVSKLHGDARKLALEHVNMFQRGEVNKRLKEMDPSSPRRLLGSKK